MPLSSIRHAKKDGTTMFSVLSLNILQSLDSHKIDVLETIGIKTIADLLHYKYIYQAQILINYAKGLIAHDFELTTYLDNGLQNTPKSDIPILTLSALKGIGPTLEATWYNEFNVKTLLELSEFVPYIEAKQYLTPDDEVFNEPASAPEDLMPKILGGIHSSVRFSSYVLYEDLTIPLNLLPAPNFGNNFSDVEIAKIFVQEYPLKLSIGYIAGFKQNWINKGTHLGEIIHTLALAPGESRNIATIEWYRRQSSSRSEETIVDEKLSSNLVHSRALNEVTRATAKEIQSGRTDISSSNSTTSEAKSSSLGGGIGASVPISPEINADVSINGSIGKSKVTSDNTQQGTIITSSSGTRDILGSVMQNINDSTIQNSSNVRSLYSTVVVSDVQQETEETSTRNVTNYNHMHALNIVSYEVVQKYGIETKMDEFKTLIYLPFKPLNFSFNTISNYWYILKEVLKLENNSLFDRYTTVINGGVIRDGFSTNDEDIFVEKLTIISTINKAKAYKSIVLGTVNIENQLTGRITNANDSTFRTYPLKNGVVQFELNNFQLKNLNELQFFVNGLSTPPINGTDKINISSNLIFELKDRNTGEQVSVSKLYQQQYTYNEIFARKGGLIQNENTNPNIGFKLASNLSNAVIDEINSLTVISDESLIQEMETFFNRRKYYFTRILLNNIESELLTDLFRNLILGRDSIDKPFTDYVNPIPIGISDNYLIFETKSLYSNYADNSQLFWQRIDDMVDTDIRKGLETKITDEVFLPTAGVFAEAILGRANGSEYIDLRRFWNWQDSPIPNSAPSINPITMASRDGGIPDNLDPNQPINTLNIMNPAPFQNPTSLNNALTALQNGNMFRDMSKSEQLATSMQNLSELAKETAKQAGTLSGNARKEALDAAIKMGQQVAKTVDNASKNKTETPTEKGGALNELDNMSSKSENKGLIDKAKAKVIGSDITSDDNLSPEINSNQLKEKTSAESAKDLLDKGAKKVRIKQGENEVEVEKDQKIKRTPNIIPTSPASYLKTYENVSAVIFDDSKLIGKIEDQGIYKKFGLKLKDFDSANQSGSLKDWVEKSQKLLEEKLNDTGLVDDTWFDNTWFDSDDREDSIIDYFTKPVPFPLNNLNTEIIRSDVKIRLTVYSDTEINYTNEIVKSIESNYDSLISTSSSSSQSLNANLNLFKNHLKSKYDYSSEEANSVLSRLSIDNIRSNVFKIQYDLRAIVTFEHKITVKDKDSGATSSKSFNSVQYEPAFLRINYEKSIVKN